MRQQVINIRETLSLHKRKKQNNTKHKNTKYTSPTLVICALLNALPPNPITVFATLLMVLYLLAVTDLVNFSIFNGMFYVISILLVICVAALIFLLASFVLGIRPKDLYQ